MSRRSELLLASLAHSAVPGARQAERLLVLVAHPDDETIGASVVLGRWPGAMVVYLTDGAPRDPQFRSPYVSGSRETYACVRAEEAASALAHVNISAERIVFLGGVDQEAIFHARRLVEAWVPIVREFKPSFIITHAYEGGHPDHDTAVVVARVGAEIAARQTGNPPELLEMTGYHAVEGTRVTGQFLTGPRLAAKDIEPAVEIKMSIEERRRKARMLGCYVSQWHVLSGIPLEPERLRPAPLYDFTRPPHEGTLWYETLGWPLSGARWRELAAQVVAEFSRLTCR